MIPVSVVVMTRNESPNIGPCLETLSRFDQVFVVDSGSGDGTAEIAARLGATVVPFEWNGGYPKKKQWCLENLPFRHMWVH
jgi:glycosyltransferase involved in cell wall biosynthesis